MGTKIQSKTYLLGCYSKMDLNNAGNGMWALYDKDKTLNNGPLDDSFSACSSVNIHIGYEKERVRQTILKHESEFRNQLQELHRLYRRQRDLMNELERREFHKHPLPAEKSKSSLFLSQTPEDANNTSNVSDFPLAHSTFGRSPASGAGIFQPPLSFIKGKSTCSLLSSNDRLHLENYESLKPKCNKFPGKMFDLELPAEVYTNDEGKQQGEKFCGVKGIESFPQERNNRVVSSREVNLSTGSGLNSASNGDALMSKSYLKRTHNLTDLNEPIWAEETSITDSFNNVVSSTCLGKDVEKWDVFASSHSGSGFWSKELSQSCLDGKNGRIVLNNRHSESDMNGNGRLTYDSKAAKSRCDDYASFGGISGNHPSTLFRSLQVETRKAHETEKFTLSDHSNAAPKRKRIIFGVDISEGNHNRSVDTSYTPSLHPLNQRSDVMNSEPTSIAPWGKTSSALAQNVVSFQDNPGLHTLAPFTGSPPNSRMRLLEFSGEKMPISNNLRSITSSRSEASHQNALCFSSQSGVKQLKGCLDLNSYVATPLGPRSELVPLKNSASSNIEQHCSGERIKAKEIIYQMNLDSLLNHSQHFFSKAKVTKGSFKDFTSPKCTIESGSRRTDDQDSQNSTKIMGFPIVNVPNISKDLIRASTLNGDGTLRGLAHNTESVTELEAKDSVAENGLKNYFSGLRHQIDLNLSLNEEEAPSAPSLPLAIVKIATTEIDLEAPAVLESDKDVSAKAEHLDKKNETCSNVSLDDSNDQYEEHVRVAAEAIIDFSLSQFNAVDTPCQLPETLPADCLLLLAEVISSYEGDSHEIKVTKGLITGDDAFDEETVPEGMDYFEFMTLKLQDTNEEEYCYKPFTSENWKDKEIGASSVPKGPRKGLARRRKDFQRDILPSLVSLSRREVTEDLQTIEEIFKASGHTWQSSLSRRRAANGRGRRRSGGLTPSQTATAVCPPPVQQPTYRELELQDRNLTGWGKRTRRLPRQRCSITNNFTPALKC